MVQRTVGSLVVVLMTPGCESTPVVVQCPESAYVQTFVAQSSVEALNTAVVRRTFPLHVDQPDLPVLRPVQHPARGEPRSVVQAHILWSSTFGDSSFQQSRHAIASQAGVGFQRQTLAGIRIWSARGFLN